MKNQGNIYPKKQQNHDAKMRHIDVSWGRLGAVFADLVQRIVGRAGVPHDSWDVLSNSLPKQSTETKHRERSQVEHL